MLNQKAKLRVNLVSESEFTVQGHGVHTAYTEMSSALSKRSDIELLTNSKVRDVDIIHVHTVGPFALTRLVLSKGKKVVSAHVVPDSFRGSLVWADLWLPLARLWLKVFYSQADLILAVSDHTQNELEKLNIKKPIKVLYNSIDTSRYKCTVKDRAAARNKFGFKKDEFVVIGAGQVQPRKRVDTFRKLAKDLPDVKFVWVGGMPFGPAAADHRKMDQLMKGHYDNLYFPGIVSHSDMADYYRAADMFLLPSDQETFGLVVVEAAAAGLPVVLRDITDYDRTFRGYALMAKDDKQFYEIVERLKTDKKFYKKAQQKSKQLADKFDSVNSTQELIDMYKGL